MTHKSFSIPDMDDVRADIKQARGRMLRRAKVKRELRDLPDRLAPDETVQCLAVASRRMRIGLLALTDRRIFWSLVGPLRMAVEFDEYPLSRIAEVRWESGGFGCGALTLVSDTLHAEFGGVPNSDGDRFTDQASALLRG